MKAAETKGLITCPYCGKGMSAITIVHNGSCKILYCYKCNSCNSRSPLAYNADDAFFNATNTIHLSETFSNKDKAVLKELREEYMRGFDAGYKEGRARGHGFSYN